MQDCKMFIMFTISVWRWSYVQLLYSPFSSVHFHLPTNILSVLCRFQLLGEFDLKDLNSFWFLQNITFSSRIKRAPKSLIVSFFFPNMKRSSCLSCTGPSAGHSEHTLPGTCVQLKDLFVESGSVQMEQYTFCQS